MANKIANRVKMTVASVASSGTGDITLGSSVPGYLTFAEGGVSNADTVPYVLEAANGDWEIGVGTYTSTGTVLARTTVTKSSIGGTVGTSKITASSTSIVMISPLAADMQSTDTLTSGTLGVARGGTGQNTYTIGDMLYASATGALSVLAAVATGNALISGGVGTAPSWGKVGLTTHVSGTLGVGNGGTGLTSLTAGYIPFGGSTTYGSDSSLFWDNTNKRLGIGTASPGTKLEVNGGSAAPIVLLNTTGASPGAVLRLLGNTSGYKNWQISASYTSLAGGLEFTPSTTNGGSTFTTPALLLSQDGNLGLGVTPSGNFLIQTPSTNSSSAANLHGFKLNYCYLGSSGGDYPYFGYNMRFQQANGSYLYDVADAATAMRFGSDIRFYVAGSGTEGNTINFTQAMTLDASSNLTVTGSITANNGGTFANANLHVSGQNITATDGSGYWAAGASTYTCGWFGSSGAMIFRAGGSSERMRIDASGNVGIGTSSPGQKLDVNGIIQSNSSFYTKSSTGYPGYYMSNASGTVLGNLNWDASNSRIVFEARSTYPFTIFTNSNERMRIDSSGNLLVGTTSQLVSERFSVNGPSANNGAVASFVVSTNTSGYNCIRAGLGTNGNNTSTSFFWGNNGVSNYFLYGNGTTSFTSDSRVKKNIVSARDGYLDDINKLRVVKYNWINHEDDTPKELGLIAQEVEQIFPGLVQETFEENMYGFKPKVLKGSVLPFMLLKAIQELAAKVSALEAKQ